jgi:hypothetical protein
MSQPIPSEVLEYERFVDTLRVTKNDLLAQLKAGVEAAQNVCSHWETGELAKAVRDLSAWMERACMAAGKAEDTFAAELPRIITVTIEGGLVQDVTGVPHGYELHVEDHDEGDETQPQWNADKECFITIYEGDAA